MTRAEREAIGFLCEEIRYNGLDDVVEIWHRLEAILQGHLNSEGEIKEMFEKPEKAK